MCPKIIHPRIEMGRGNTEAEVHILQTLSNGKNWVIFRKKLPKFEITV
jgi:hypothetical protein